MWWIALAACVETEEPELATSEAEVVTPGQRPKPLFPPDILWENGPGIAYHSYLSPVRTTYDGRIAFESESPANFHGRCFRLIRPEILSGHISTTVQELATPLTDRWCLPQDQFHGTQFVFGSRELGIQGALCDAAPTQPPGRVDPRATNAQPQPCAGNPARDCYVVTTITHMETPTNVPEEVWSRQFRIEVSNPKTALARIEAVTPLAPAQMSTQNGSILEPVVSGDGRVLVYHDGRDTKYSVNPAGGPYPPCDARGFTAALPISSMHTDARMAVYGLAKFPLRDSENNVVPANAEVGGAYPWIDRDVSNLFITTAGASLYYQDDAGVIRSKYPVLSVPSPSPQSPNPPTNLNEIRAIGDIGGRSGIMAMGLWTQGKMVVLDNRLNNSDLAILHNCQSPPNSSGDYCALPPIHDRMIDLYANTPGGTRIGASNSFFIGSPENVLNYDPDMRPVTPRDVVWQLAATTGTDEVAFDDYLLTRALVISPMNPSVGNTHPLLAERNYRDGFEYTGTFTGRGFTRDPHVQNAAASRHWNLPGFGLLLGGARVEPIAAGGVRGKGIWLDGVNDRIEYTVPAQTQSSDMNTSAWMYSLWLHSTSPLTTTPARVLRTPDGSEALLTSGGLVLRKGAASTTVAIPAALLPSSTRYTHLAIVSTPSGGGTAFTVYVNGYLFATTTVGTPMLRMSAGTLTVGAAASGQPGFTGWIDELKVIARAPNREEMCNHAYGTLVGVTSGPGYNAAASYPASSHTAISSALGTGTYPRYYCESQIIAPADTAGYVCKFSRDNARCVGRRVLIPEGPLVHGAPRPGSTGNTFCTSCHSNINPSTTMKTEALAFRTIALEDDRRRQPMQPDPLLFGVIPTNLLGPGKPASTQPAPAAGLEVDPLQLAAGDLCVPTATRLCLMNRRYSVTLAWSNPSNGTSGAGSAIPHTINTGHFWFFSSANVEVTVKVLDGATVNGRSWVFQGGITSLAYTLTVYDHWNQTTRTYTKAAGTQPDGTVCGTQDTSAFFSNVAMGPLDPVTPGAPLGPPSGTGPCVPSATQLCLLNKRFAVTVTWRQANNGPTGQGSVRGEQTSQTGFFTFFSPDNIELLVKVIDGTTVNGKYWLFYGSLTNVGYDITLRDVTTGATRTFTSAPGQQCGRLITDAL